MRRVSKAGQSDTLKILRIRAKNYVMDVNTTVDGSLNPLEIQMNCTPVCVCVSRRKGNVNQGR